MQQDKLQRARKAPDKMVQEVAHAQTNQQSMLKMLSSYYEDSRLHAVSRPLDKIMQSRYQAHFGPAAGHIKLFENPDLDPIGEKGFAKGNEVHVARSVFSNPKEFHSVMDHEMTHIAQQNGGGVTGQGLLLDPGLERAANIGDSAMIHASTLMDAGAAPIQGNLATSIFQRIINKIRTITNFGNYRTQKEAARTAARNLVETVPQGTFGSERHMQALRQANDFKNDFPGDDDYAAHAQAEAKRLAEQYIINDDDYQRAVEKLAPQMQQYDDLQQQYDSLQEGDTAVNDNDRAEHSNESLKKLNQMENQLLANFGQNRGRSNNAHIAALHQKIDTARQAQMSQMKSIGSYQSGMQNLRTQLDNIHLPDDKNGTEQDNHDNLDKLRQFEEQLYNFQGTFMGAADDGDFQDLQNELQTKYEDHYEQIQKKNWSFHAYSGSGVDDGAAGALWQEILSGTGRFTINDQQEVHTRGIDTEGNIGAVKEEHCKGFQKKAMGHIGRLLSTRTGFKLLRELSSTDETKTAQLRPVRKHKDSNGGNITYDGPGAVPVKNGSGIPTDSPHEGGFQKSKNGSSTDMKQGTGLSSWAKISDTERDSSVRTVRRDGTQVLNPQFVIAGHELIHALHNIKGINQKFREVAANEQEKDGVLQRDSYWTNLEELATMFGADLHYGGNRLGQSEEMQANPDLQRYVMEINEQRLRGELGIQGRDYHNLSRAF